MNAAASGSTEPVKVHLLDREFLIGCSEDERAGLIAAAAVLDARMRELRGGAANPSFDRLAVLVALSVTHEFLSLKHERETRDALLGNSIEQLQRKLDAALSQT